MSCGPAAIVDRSILDGQPIRAISYLEPIDVWDSGFCLFAGEPDEDLATTLICLDCLTEEHPEITCGMEVAQRYGEAIRDGATWVSL